MRIAAIVILYNPVEAVISNIESYYNQIEKVFVFDNSEREMAVKETLLTLSKIEFYQDFQNQGIAVRLNQGCKKAISEKFDWLLMMDQDTHFSADAISTYFNCVTNHPSKNVAVFGTEYQQKFVENSGGCVAKEAAHLITSGSLLNLSLVESIGPFDEKLFIDYVDYDYCYRAIAARFALIKFANVYLRHELGEPVYRSSIKSLFLVKKKKEIHSPLRCYYMYRNMLYLEEKFKSQDKKLVKKIRKDVLSRIRICLLYGRQSLSILKYLSLAKKDFKEGKMGKLAV